MIIQDKKSRSGRSGAGLFYAIIYANVRTVQSQ